MRQLETTAADIGMIRLSQSELGVLGDGGSRFARRLTVDQHDARQDQRLRALSRSCQASLDY